ncbi:AAA domain-containing protein [Polymorphospora rubra]|uniref:Caspase domain-containing protein n=1 Tax=Polymorphospora rubra TaxID=338584 RepID=A0A810MSY5_9ACTN|nr:AAA domain-containing protein [Polymorphospora rubra]BCJ64346.1 hypothetical protein Prubr_13670 [Polymorphospora rubra]
MGRYALLIGTATYHADGQLQPLPSVRQDLAQLKTLLDSHGEFDEVRAELDLPATQMTQVVQDFYQARRTGDLALLYYSGHGVVMDADQESVFLAATDTVTGSLHGTALDTDGPLRHMLNITKASQKVVLIDCCYSGSFSTRHRFRGGVRQEARRGRRERGTFVLTSSNHMKASKVQGPDRPSVFTEVLLAGLGGAAQGIADDGWITTNDLSRYAMTEMARRHQHAPTESSEGVSTPIPLTAAPGSEAAARQTTSTVPTAADDAPFDADQWRRLLTYYVNCMQRSKALQSFIDPRQASTYTAAPPGPEAILLATAPVQLHGQAATLAGRVRAEGKELQYGYPVVAVRAGRQRQIRLTPLLVCDVTVGPDDVLHASFPPRPSPALVDLLQLSEVESDELVQQVERVFVPGDRAALTATVDLLLKTFGLTPLVDPDPTALAGQIRPGPIDRVQNAAVLFMVDGADSPQRQLVSDLQDMIKNPKAIDGTALAALATRPPEVEPASILQVALSPVNEAQEEVIQAAMSRTLTVAQGPPGTGKSQLVTALLATATAAGQSVLIGSTSNQAVDSVVDRVTDLIGPGLLLRTGNKEHRLQEPKHLADILTAYPPAARDVAPDEHTPAGELRLISDELSGLRRVLDEHRTIERDLADLADLAAERGSDQVDEVALPDDEAALARLVRMTDLALTSRWFGWWYRRRLRRFGAADREAVASLAERAVLKLRWRERRQRLAGLPDGDAAWQRLLELVNGERPARSGELLRAQIARRVTAGVRLLQNRADEMAKPNAYSRAYFPEILRVLPGWAVTALSARQLDRKPGLYDLVVIDEAAQCTVPAILPMLYRAKRALIIGDPRQLAPVVDLPEGDDVAEQVKAGLGTGWLTARRLAYARHSAYDAFAASAGATHLLDEHYRCHPDIVDIPNREVYQGRLTILTDPRRLAAPAEPAMRWQDVTGAFVRGQTGSGRNPAEIAEVVAEVARLRAAYPDASVGVVTPLAAHKRNLAAALGAAGLHDNLLCETIHRFQGSERDIMVISPVGAHGISDSTRNWLVHQTNLWNVAITRARSQLVVVGDRSWWASQRGLLAALATSREPTEGTPDAAPNPADRLHAALRKRGLTVRRDVTMSGHTLDLLVRAGDAEVAVLVDDPTGNADGRALRKVLAQIDITNGKTTVRRVPVWRCLAEPEQVAAELSEYLGRR